MILCETFLQMYTTIFSGLPEYVDEASTWKIIGTSSVPVSPSLTESEQTFDMTSLNEERIEDLDSLPTTMLVTEERHFEVISFYSSMKRKKAV